jgi:hypothetical protein
LISTHGVTYNCNHRREGVEGRCTVSGHQVTEEELRRAAIQTAMRIASAGYEWDSWTDGEWHTLVRGEHFYGTVFNFRSTVYDRAAKLGLKANTRVHGSSVIRVRFYQPEVVVEYDLDAQEQE